MNQGQVSPQQNVYKIILSLVLIGLIVNLDRIFLLESGPLRIIDLASTIVAKFKTVGDFWRHPVDYAWNASYMRGWPIYLEGIHPQHISCLLSSFLPVPVAFLIYQVILDVLILIGAFLFVYNFLGFRLQTALYVAVLNLSMFYWFNENPIISQMPLLPLIIAISAIGKQPIPFGLRMVLFVIGLLMFYPPAVPAMPAIQLLCVFFLSARDNRFRNILSVFIVWMIFILFTLPNLIGVLMHWGEANRVLWETKPASFNMKTLLHYITNMFVWFPALCVVPLFSAFKTPKVIFLFVTMFIVAMISSHAQLIAEIPILGVFSLGVPRLVYFNSFLVLLMLAYVIEKEGAITGWRQHIFRLLRALFFVGIGWVVLRQMHNPYVLKYFLVLSCISIFFIHLNVLRFGVKGYYLIIIAVLFLVPFKYFYISLNERTPYGYVYVDPFIYKSPIVPYRVVSMYNGNVSSVIFSLSQPLMKGQEIFDGASAFYRGKDAENWMKYVLTKNDPWDFRSWNEAMGLNEVIWNANKESILKWLKINNVAFIRSEVPLNDASLNLEQIEPITYDFFAKDRKGLRIWYLYRINGFSSRVFAVTKTELLNANGQLLDDDALFLRWENLNTTNINVDTYVPSRMIWQGTFDNQSILTSINYDKGWHLLVDDKEEKGHIEEGPFGALKILPKKGFHKYTLYYKDFFIYYAGVAACMAWLSLWLYLTWFTKKEQHLCQHIK